MGFTVGSPVMPPGYGVSVSGTGSFEGVDLVTEAELTAGLGTSVPLGVRSWFDIMSYGAVADDSTDCLAAFTAAISAAHAAGGGVVFVPAGRFKVSSSVDVAYDDIEIAGFSWKSVIHCTANVPVVSAHGNINRFILRDLTVEGDGDAAKTSQRGWQGQNVTDYQIRRVRAYNLGYDGILPLDGCVGGLIEGCLVDTCKDDGINVGGGGSGVAATTRTKVIGNTVRNCTDDGIHVSDFSNDTTVVGNTIYGCSNSISLYSTTNAVIADNICEDPTNYGIAVPTGSGACSYFSIHGNIIKDAARGINIKLGATYYDIHDNVIINATDYGIIVTETAPFSSYASIHDNTIQGGCATAPIALANPSDVLVERNNIQGISTAVSLGTGSRVVYVPWDRPFDSNLLATGEETFSRDFIVTGTVATGSQSLRLSYFTARKTHTATGIRVISGTTAAGATPSLIKFGLFTVASNGDLTLVAATDSDTTMLASLTTPYTKAFSASSGPGVTSYQLVAGNRYAIGVLVVTAATAPTLTGQNALTGTEAGLAPQLAGVVSGQSDFPSTPFTIAAGSVTVSGTRFYAVATP